MVERIDSQLRRMGQDLKNVIEQMNSAASAQEENDEVIYIYIYIYIYMYINICIHCIYMHRVTYNVCVL